MASWVDSISEDAATGRLADVYEETRKERGVVGNIYQAQSLRPEALDLHRRMHLELFFSDGPLARRLKEMIAVVVSRTTGSEYCLAHHTDSLGRHTTAPGLPALIATDYTHAPLPPDERLLLDHVVKLTKTPNAITEGDIDRLRDVGFKDAQIVEATQIVAYVNYLTRIATGLGVTHDDVGAPYRY